ncbi:MAG TPA: signal peptide peptidase SppA [SAR86 cluster bacterium]|nr:signal peptide peptidase SppA [SAR86 cluster bacterium]|tara:strand:+ start:159 stop:1994 length:1836 start_codon:yes stop_codon:yes gene_type:complete
MEQKSFFQRLKENPFSWLFSGELFFLSLNSLFVLIVLISIISSITSLFTDSYEDPTGKALVLAPPGPIVEQVAVTNDPFSLVNGSLPSELYVGDLLEVLETASTDKRVTDIVLRLDNIDGTGQVVLYDIGSALQKIRDAGKNIIAVGDSYSRSAYYLASFANEIIMNPDGWLFLDGFGRSKLYYKSFLDKFKIDFNIFRVGTFKSAVEPYLRDNMSEEAKQANLAYLEVLWDSWKKEVTGNRASDLKKDIQFLVDNSDEIIQDSEKGMADALYSYGLVDQLLSRSEQRKYLRDKFGDSEDEESFSQISGFEYFQLIQSEKDDNISENKIAVVIARGTIVDGTQPPGLIGGDSTSKLIKEAHENESVKAIVLRVDSGGGGVFASELIREEIVVAKEKGIKIIASMGNVAASGGYWISANANEIWASHNTITGSIGIFGMYPTFNRALNDIGINQDGVKTSRIDLSGRPTQKIDPALSRILQKEIEYGYERFLNLVSSARNMSVEEVDKIAQGRVWAGSKALELGLVDNLGNLKDAINRAAELAELDEYTTYLPSQDLDWKQRILSNFSNILIGLIPESLRENLVIKTIEVLNEIDSFNDPKGLYIRCEDCLI